MAAAKAADPDLPVDTGEPMATQSRQVLMIATELGALNYRQPYNTSNADQLTALRKELGRRADPPADGGTYYLVYLAAEGHDQQPVLIPEGEVRAFVFAVVLLHLGPDAARRVLFRKGMLPA